jgi:oligopeptide/dipeptide ABC transporter ATP-binding protein
MDSEPSDPTLDALSADILAGMREWPLQHSDATLLEVEHALDQRWYRLRARMLQDLALQRETTTWQSVSMLDASLRMSIVNSFRDLKEQQGVSVIYITHDLATAYYAADRIAVMLRGWVVELGSTEQVLGKPPHPYTQILKSSVPEPDPALKWTDRIALARPEAEDYLMAGCKFAGRCPFVMDVCRSAVPRDVVAEGRIVKCHLYDPAISDAAKQPARASIPLEPVSG